MPETGSVTLTTVWLNLASDPTVFASFSNMAALKLTGTVTGGVRRLAGGRDRHIRQAGEDQQADLDLPVCDRDQIAWLEAHIGDVVCARDDRGRKFWGVYAAVAIDEIRVTPLLGNASLSLLAVTFDESVA